MAKIRADFKDVLHVGDVYLKAGEEVPEGLTVPDEYLDGRTKTAADKAAAGDKADGKTAAKK